MPNPCRGRLLIGSILGSELGVLVALFLCMFQAEADSHQYTNRLLILAAAFLGLSLLRRKALPAGAEL